MLLGEQDRGVCTFGALKVSDVNMASREEAAPMMRPRSIDDADPHETDGSLRVCERVPPPLKTDKRFLDEVLSSCPITDKQIGKRQQPAALSAEYLRDLRDVAGAELRHPVWARRLCCR